MNAERSEKLADPVELSAEFEGEIRDLIRSRDVTFLRSPGKSSGDVNNLASLIQRVAGGSTGEIDNLILRLQEMRDYLRDEAERVQGEIAKYATVSKAAREQIEVLSDTLDGWRERGIAPSAAASQD